VLFVQPRPLVPREAASTTGSRPFETPLLVSGARCILRYIALPFVLPLLGVATGAAFGILLLLDVVAAVAIVTTLRRLWRLQHPRRWQYLVVALGLTALIGFFFVNDTSVVFAGA
jgi:ABC-type iron transport system FetAB permease component